MRPLIFGLLVAISGCAVDRGGSDVVPSSESETSLRGLLPEDAVLVGVALAPDGKRYVLDRRSGLYELGESSATPVWTTLGSGDSTWAIATGLGLLPIVLTDVVALDNERFAITAENDGFLLDLRD